MYSREASYHGVGIFRHPHAHNHLLRHPLPMGLQHLDYDLLLIVAQYLSARDFRSVTLAFKWDIKEERACRHLLRVSSLP
jgi:hypothetical protein